MLSYGKLGTWIVGRVNATRYKIVLYIKKGLSYQALQQSVLNILHTLRLLLMAMQLQISAFASTLSTWFTATINVRLENTDSSQFGSSIVIVEKWLLKQ